MCWVLLRLRGSSGEADRKCFCPVDSTKVTGRTGTGLKLLTISEFRSKTAEMKRLFFSCYGDGV